jgi:NDP-sugar pyrophosphorylase family protein
VEAIILAGGQAERLGDAAAGRPKALVDVGGRPLAAYQVGQLARAGVDRVIVSCSAEHTAAFERELAGIGPEIVVAPETERLGRGGGLRNAARYRREDGPAYALNGDELLDLEFGALLAYHQERQPAATITVVAPPSPFGVVDVRDDGLVAGFEEATTLPVWVSCGVYVLGDEAFSLLPERGDHEQSTFPELAAAGRLLAYRHAGTWITVNTPKDLRRAREYVAAHPQQL